MKHTPTRTVARISRKSAWQAVDRPGLNQLRRLSPRRLHLTALLLAPLLTPLAALHAADVPAKNSDIPVTAAEGGRFVHAEGAGLTRAGRPFKAVGFNQPDLFTSLLLDGEAGRKKSFTAIEDAGRSEVRFLRFWASGFWPRDMQRYSDDRPAYWAAMDEIFSCARRHNVMLVPSIFWNNFLWPDLCDEPRQAILDPKSKTYAAMLTYAKELVSRYQDDSNILLWEIGNEYASGVDLNLAERPRDNGAGSRNLGTRPERTLDDSITTDMLRSMYKSITAHIHTFDPNHLVTSGDAGPRDTSRSLRESFPKTIWNKDTLNDHLASLLTVTPEPLDVMSIHYYGNLEGRFPPGEKPRLVGGLNSRALELLTAYARTANVARMPLFVGELGQHDPRFIEDPDARFACAAIDLLEKEGADLIAIWAWHFPHHPQETVTGSTYPALMKRVRQFNLQHASGTPSTTAE
jgi:mannan endo-1,4-beta-mannosidase